VEYVYAGMAKKIAISIRPAEKWETTFYITEMPFDAK
jgi:hypothetical protein